MLLREPSADQGEHGERGGTASPSGKLGRSPDFRSESLLLGHRRELRRPADYERLLTPRLTCSRTQPKLMRATDPATANSAGNLLGGVPERGAPTGGSEVGAGGGTVAAGVTVALGVSVAGGVMAAPGVLVSVGATVTVDVGVMMGAGPWKT